MFGRKKPAATATYFRLGPHPDYDRKGYAKATLPPAFRHEYAGHGNTYHLWDVPTLGLVGGTQTPDWLLNDAGLPLVSEALRTALAAAAAPQDVLHFLPVELPGAPVPYYILCLPYRKKVQVLRQQNINPETEGLTGEPPISQPAVGPHRVFTYLDPRPERRNDVLLAGPAAEALRSSGLTGFALAPLPATGLGVLSALRPTQTVPGA
jgi:hypothetical protein